jgi:hypothetical protein
MMVKTITLKREDIMKKFLIGLMALGSLTAFAGTCNVTSVDGGLQHPYQNNYYSSEAIHKKKSLTLVYPNVPSAVECFNLTKEFLEINPTRNLKYKYTEIKEGTVNAEIQESPSH